MKYKAILFDADGMTIISQKFSDRIQAEYGISWEKMKSFFQGPFSQCQLGRADLKEELVKVMGEWGWKGTVEELMNYWFKTGSEINLGIPELIKGLQDQGTKCYLATNQEKYRAAYLRNELGLGKIFDGMMVSADIGHMKDEEAFFVEAVNQLQEPRDQILFVDHEEKNLKAAASVGLTRYKYETLGAFREYLNN